MKTQIHELRTRIDGLAQLVKSMDKPILMISNDIKADYIDDFIDDYKMRGGIISVPITSQAEYIGPSLSFLAESYKSLLLTKAWLGKVLAELGEETPYKNEGNRKTVEDIEPTADRNIPINNGAELIKGKIGTCEEGNAGYSFGKIEDCRNENFEYFSDKTYIEKIDWLREEIEKVNDDLRNTIYPPFQILKMQCEYSMVNNYNQSINYLTEARFFLGFELSRIKEQSK